MIRPGSIAKYVLMGGMGIQRKSILQLSIGNNTELYASVRIYIDIQLQIHFIYSEDGLNIQCKPCPCPNTKASGHSFADKCSLNTTAEPPSPVCECQKEYKGKNMTFG